MAAPTIIEIHPDNEETGIILADQISVTFDQEIDPTTVQIIVTGPDQDRWTGPDLVRWDDVDADEDDDVLATPGYHGVVDGVLSFEKVDVSGNGVSGNDYSGQGTMWRTKVVFTPTIPLAPSTEYTVFVPGDEALDDGTLSGTTTRTVYDVVIGANTGTGTVYLTGGYRGTIDDVFYVKVKASGNAGSGLLFYWWRGSAPLVVRELNTKLTSQILADGVSVRFEGAFITDDVFSVVVEPPVCLAETYTWTFSTGVGSITTVPSTTSQSVPIGGFSPLGVVSTTTGALSITSIRPRERATNLDPASITQVVIIFNKDLDETTISSNTITITTEPVNGEDDVNTFVHAGELALTFDVASNVLTITGLVDNLYENNAVYLWMDKSVAATDETTLTEDYTYFFTTTYSPMYASVKRIRLDMGNIVSSIPDDTINLAIFEASLEADAFTFGNLVGGSASMQNYFTFARRQFTICLAEQNLLMAITSSGDGIGSGGKSKRLADLDVSYNNVANAKNLLDKVASCRVKWESALTSAGQIGPGTSQRPSMVIKGANDPDRPEFGRDWEPISTTNFDSEVPAANTSTLVSTSRRWRRDFLTNRWGSRFK